MLCAAAGCCNTIFFLSRVYIPCIYVLNKIDQISIEELDIIYKVPHCVPISAHHRWNFDDLLEKIWDYLKLVRMWVTIVAFCGVKSKAETEEYLKNGWGIIIL